MIIDKFKGLTQYMPSNSKNRSAMLDVYRGCAVLLMMIFHFCWDLRAFGYLKYSLKDPFWVDFRGVIMILFISAVGWSAYLANKNGFRRNAFIKRQAKLLVCATIISLGTYIAFPNNWIFFGIIHFIFLASLIITPFARRPWTSLIIALILLTLYYFNDAVREFSLHHFLANNYHFPTYTLDLVNIFPWIIVLFAGPILGYFKLHKLALPNHPSLALLAFLGRHALLIYLTHQVFLYGLVSFFHFIINLTK